jgi:hypothetical protein
MQKMMKTLEYLKVIIRFPSYDREAQERMHDVSLYLFQWHASEGSDFILNFVLCDESWFHHFDP